MSPRIERDTETLQPHACPEEMNYHTQHASHYCIRWCGSLYSGLDILLSGIQRQSAYAENICRPATISNFVSRLISFILF